LQLRQTEIDQFRDKGYLRTQNASPWSRWIYSFLHNSVKNQEINRRRDVFYCDTDFTPLEALPDGCLLASVS
jgi:hypothetical protein